MKNLNKPITILQILLLATVLILTRTTSAAVTIDVIALFSPEAEALYPDTQTRIMALFTEANQVHTNSATGITFNAVLIMPYDGPNTSEVNSAGLTTMDSDPVLAMLRETYGADLVVLFTAKTSSFCGLGRLGQGNGTDGITPFEFNRDTNAFSISGIDCDGQTVAHEFGHNFGLSHSLAQGEVGNIVDYGRGYGINSSFVTIMAYSNFFNNAPRVPRFSKFDDNNCMGQPCGIQPGQPMEADSFRAMDIVDEDISNYYPTMNVPANQDTDGDNMPDTWEWENGLNGFIAADGPMDLDEDGWSNVQEFYAMTDPRNNSSFPTPGGAGVDSDGDGTNDPQDAFPFDPNETIDTDNDGIGNNMDVDDDGDGMDDSFEIFHALDSLNPADAGNDADGDGATNLEEYESDTDPTSSASRPATQIVFRLSKHTSGAQGNDDSGTPLDDLSRPVSISRNGRYVAFESSADNLTSDDFNISKDVFVRDRSTGTTDLISTSATSEQGLADSYGPAIANNAMLVAFESASSNLVSSDANSRADVFLKNLVNGQIELISVASDSSQGNSDSGSAHVSADGSRVVFHSWASNLVGSDNNNWRDIFIRNRNNNTTSRVSISTMGAEGNSTSEMPTVSNDGTITAFHSFATTLLSNDGNGGFPDSFIHNSNSGTTEVVSVNSSGNQTNGNSLRPAVSGDGRYVAFQSDSFSLTPGITNGNVDIFRHDRTTGTTIRVSLSSNGTEANGDSRNASISDDGRYIVFESSATNLVTGDTNGADDVFMHDTVTGETTVISVSLSGNCGNNHSRNPRIAGNGSAVAFNSLATDLVYWDQNGKADVFVFETGLSSDSIKQDFDADQDSDVLLRNSSTGQWRRFDMQSGLAASSGNPLLWTGPAYQYRGSGDFDGDGDSDVLMRNPSNGAWWRFTIQNGVVVGGGNPLLWSGLAWEFRDIADLDGDGDDDVLLRNTNTGQWRRFDMQSGSAVSSGNPLLWTGPAYQFVGSGDFDADGDDDVIMRNPSNGAWWRFTIQNGVVVGGGNPLLWSGLAWEFRAVANMDGDGDDDVLLRNTNTGQWRRFDMQSGSAVSSGNPLLWTGPAYQYRGSGDFDADGDSDVLMRNPGNGAWWRFTIQNGVVVGGGNPLLWSGLNWEFRGN